MSRQYFRELLEPLALADFAPVTVTNTEATIAPVSATSGLAIPATAIRPGQAYKITAAGLITTSATAVNVTINPRWGTSAAGVLLGASTTVAKTASLTNVPFVVQLWAQFRTVNNVTATQSTVIAHGTFESAAVARDMVFGGTTATIDTTTAQGFWLGLLASGADTSTITTKTVLVETLN
jgi:hypothetical protein